MHAKRFFSLKKVIRCDFLYKNNIFFVQFFFFESIDEVLIYENYACFYRNGFDSMSKCDYRTFGVKH